MVECSSEKEIICKKKNKICNKKTGRCNKIPDIQINNNKLLCTSEKELICKKKNKICNKKTGRCNKIPDIQINKKPKTIIKTSKKSLTSLEKISKLKKIWKKVKLNSNNHKKKAAKIIVKHLLPFITKTFTLRNRIRYGHEIKKGFHKIVKSNDIKKLYNHNINTNALKINELNNYNLYDDIHLFKKIGTDSVYGSIYNTKYKINDKYYNICGKIMCSTQGNIEETKLLKTVTEFTLNETTPHFPILYYNGSITKNNELKNKNLLLPEAVRKCNNFILSFNEIFSGDLKTFMHECKHKNDKNILINSLEQIFISILTFHTKINLSHNDCHWGNFLYHKIKPGGYIHYKIFNRDIYLKNYGYLWIIWDYGLTSPLHFNKKYADYYRVLNAFIRNNDGGWNDKLKHKINRAINIRDNMIRLTNPYDTFESRLFDVLFNYHSDVYNKPSNKEIINLNKPYVIN